MEVTKEHMFKMSRKEAFPAPDSPENRYYEGYSQTEKYEIDTWLKAVICSSVAFLFVVIILAGFGIGGFYLDPAVLTALIVSVVGISGAQGIRKLFVPIEQ